MKRCSVQTKFGVVTLVEDRGAIVALEWGGAWRETSALLGEAVAQVSAYDRGALTAFDLPTVVQASDFQQRVCAQIAGIPYGETVTYGEIAKAVGASAQAVGAACGGNPIPIIIPCHRVMGAKGLTGFSGRGGVETKVALLRHERAGGFLI